MKPNHVIFGAISGFAVGLSGIDIIVNAFQHTIPSLLAVICFVLGVATIKIILHEAQGETQ